MTHPNPFAAEIHRNILRGNPFEREARVMCEEYGLEPSPEQVARFAMHLTNRQYRIEVAPLEKMLLRIASVRTTKTIRHADGKLTALAPTPSATEKMIYAAIEQARVRAFGAGN